MQVVSAFFADYVAVYDQKLFVQGGVWDWYGVLKEDLPFEPVVSLALIQQVAADDRGKTCVTRIKVIRPDGSEVERGELQYEISADFEPDPVCQGINLPLPIDQLGRYVVMLESASNAFALPLKVRVP